MKEFYISIETVGNNIVERYIDENGKERTREVEYLPTMFRHCKEESKYKDIYGKNLCSSKISINERCTRLDETNGRHRSRSSRYERF